MQPDEIAVAILRQGNEMVYAVGPSPEWTLFLLNIEHGTSVRSRQSYPSFIQTAQAFRAGAIIWENDR